MDILVALTDERTRLQQRLTGIQTAILALQGSDPGPSRAQAVGNRALKPKRTMSAAAKAKISKATRERWAKYRAQKAKKSK
jgi:hypothetical protein